MRPTICLDLSGGVEGVKVVCVGATREGKRKGSSVFVLRGELKEKEKKEEEEEEEEDKDGGKSGK